MQENADSRSNKGIVQFEMNIYSVCICLIHIRQIQKMIRQGKGIRCLWKEIEGKISPVS